MSMAEIIRVDVEKGEKGLLYATSPQLKGLLVGRKDLDELASEIPKSIGQLYSAKGTNVVVVSANGSNESWFTYVVMPTEALKGLLAASNWKR